jgi:predicted dehydrogenase
MSEKLRLGLVGLGNMGRVHAANLLSGKVPRIELTAVAETNPESLANFPGLKAYPNFEAMAQAGGLDAVLIATPHTLHTAQGIQALAAGFHVLVEKPISVHKADAERLCAAHTRSDRVFAVMFNQRTDPLYVRLRELVRGGDLGEIRRVHWTVTHWFRTARYYASGGWRATWAGEGGGVLLNQCPHHLDLLQWIFGRPRRVRAFAQFGRYHPIEVEDDVTAYLEFEGGATGVFIASTGEAPGTNRLEVAAENGRVTVEGDRLVWARNAVPMSEFSRTSPLPFALPATSETVFTVPDHGEQHVGILKNFADAALDGVPLIAPAAEGLPSVELANAMLLSTWTGQTVELPFPAELYARWLEKKIAAAVKDLEMGRGRPH